MAHDDTIETPSTSVSLLPEDELESVDCFLADLLQYVMDWSRGSYDWTLTEFRSCNDSDGELNKDSAVTRVSVSESANEI